MGVAIIAGGGSLNGSAPNMMRGGVGTWLLFLQSK